MKNYGQRYCTGHNEQSHPKEKEMQEGKVAFWVGFINNWEKKRSEKEGRKGKEEIKTSR